MININTKIKKVLLFLTFILSLLFINTTDIKAYYTNNDTITSNTLKINKNKYYNQNILNIVFPHESIVKNGVTITRNGEKIILNGRATADTDIRIDQFNEWDSNLWSLQKNKTLYAKIFQNSNYVQFNVLQNQTWLSVIRTTNSSSYTTSNTDLNNLFSYIYFTNGTNFNNYEIRLMLSYIPINQYSEPLKFGYYVSNTSSNSFNLTFIDNYNSNNTYILTNNNIVYLPFQFDSNSKSPTFSYNVIQNANSNISTPINIKFSPVFTGTLKEGNSNNLVSEFIYTYNYLYYKNLKLSTYKDISLGDMLSIVFPNNNNDGNSYTIENENVVMSNNIISSYTSKITQNNIIDRNIYFNGYNSLYTFNINTYMYTNQNGLIYSINFESINIGVMNSTINYSYSSSNNNDLEIYNVCEGNIFQDFNCNVSNALTWTIFNIPILGPIIGFISNLISLFENLVTALTWYQNLGILFGIFILIMFLKILSILWKGKDE